MQGTCRLHIYLYPGETLRLLLNQETNFSVQCCGNRYALFPHPASSAGTWQDKGNPAVFSSTPPLPKNMKMHSCQDVSHTIIESKLILIRKTTSIRKGVRACQSWVVSPVLAFTNCVIWNEGLKHWKAFVSSSAKAGVNTPSRVAAETNAWRARGS